MAAMLIRPSRVPPLAGDTGFADWNFSTAEETGLIRKALVLGLLIWTAGFANAKSTKLVTSWKNPQYSPTKFHRVLILGMSANPGTRADFEDALSQLVGREGVEAVPGNTILLRPEGTQLNLDYLKTQVKEFKIDAVIVSRLIKIDKDVKHVPGGPYIMPPYYGSFYGYYSAIYPIVYSPDYLREDTTIRVETNVYGVASGEGQLLWTGVSDTFNPSSAKKVIDGLSKLIVKELQKEAILQ
jgi:hypothetical protein